MLSIQACDEQDVRSLFADAKKEGVVVKPLKSPSVFFMAVCGEEVVGFARLCWLSPARARLSNAFVVPTARGRGVGKALIEARLDRAGGVQMDVFAYWPAMYEIYGFSIVSHRKTVNGDTYYMRRPRDRHN